MNQKKFSQFLHNAYENNAKIINYNDTFLFNRCVSKISMIFMSVQNTKKTFCFVKFIIITNLK